jgi:hypothetical protein
MPSVVDICNESLDLLGAATITSLTQNSKEARLCNRNFEPVRDAVFRAHPWNVATMYKIEGRKILSNESTCSIIYLGRVEDTELYDSLLTSALAHRLAAKIAYAITGSSTIAQSMQGLYELRLREAKSVDAMEGYPEQPLADTYINIRY